MGRFKALTCASLLAMSAVPAAHAADLLPPPPPIEAPQLRGPVEDTGFYLRTDVGVGLQSGSSLRSTYGDGYSTEASLGAYEGPMSVGDAMLMDIGAGYQFNSWLRADVTGEYRSSANYNAKNFYQYTGTGSNCPVGGSSSTAGNVSCGDNYTAMLRGGLFLANGYLDLGTWMGATPYVGAGVGMYTYGMSTITDQSMSQPNGWGIGPAHNSANFAWALMTGVAFNLAPNLKLDIGYRYVDMGSIATGAITCSSTANGNCHYETQHFKLASNDLRVGLRWMLDPRVAVLEPMPVRAKY